MLSKLVSFIQALGLVAVIAALLILIPIIASIIFLVGMVVIVYLMIRDYKAERY